MVKISYHEINRRLCLGAEPHSRCLFVTRHNQDSQVQVVMFDKGSAKECGREVGSCHWNSLKRYIYALFRLPTWSSFLLFKSCHDLRSWPRVDEPTLLSFLPYKPCTCIIAVQPPPAVFVLSPPLCWARITIRLQIGCTIHVIALFARNSWPSFFISFLGDCHTKFVLPPSIDLLQN